MEALQKPARYTDEEWEVVKDLAEPDVRIPTDEFAPAMRTVLRDIARLAVRLQVELPAVVEELMSRMDDDSLKALQSYRDMTYLELQLWHGDMKLDVFGRGYLTRR